MQGLVRAGLSLIEGPSGRSPIQEQARRRLARLGKMSLQRPRFNNQNGLFRLGGCHRLQEWWGETVKQCDALFFFRLVKKKGQPTSEPIVGSEVGSVIQSPQSKSASSPC
jgi:hypothetical protein